MQCLLRSCLYSTRAGQVALALTRTWNGTATRDSKLPAHCSSFLGHIGAFHRLCYSSAQSRSQSDSPFSKSSPKRYTVRAYNGGSPESKPKGGTKSTSESPWNTFVRKLAVFLGGLILAGALLVASLPGLASTTAGLKVVTGLVNKNIPGTVSVESVSAGWARPLHVRGVSLETPEHEKVLTVEGLATEASLLSLATGRAGLGGLEIEGAWINGLEDNTRGVPKLVLAVTKPEKLPPAQEWTKRKAYVQSASRTAPAPPSELVDLEVIVEASPAGARITHSHILLPWDKAALIGTSLQVNIDTGHLAAAMDKAVAQKASRSSIPVVASARSATLRFGGAGVAQASAGKVELVRSLEAEVEVSPATGQLVLGRLNPLLRGVVSREDSLPDVRVKIFPKDMTLPADEYRMRVDPMRVTLGKGDLVRGVLQLLSRGVAGRTLPLQTSAVHAVVNVDGHVECARFDLLIADSVHIATWGSMDLRKGDISMTLAIPSSTLERTLGIEGLSPDYYLQIPLVGTVDAPKVDWRSAGVRVGRLVAQTRAQKRGGYAASVWKLLPEERGVPVPALQEPLPWTNKQ